ncbi:MAG: hypothetical protein R6W90_06140 [Ignavibacteriaceae bacterium]
MKLIIKFITILILLVMWAACNPFAPAYDENLSDGSTISDLTTTDGVFRNLQYAYTFKDTIIYGDLINQDFIFSFRNFREDQVFDDSWGREEEMRATYGLFQNAQRLDLIWNNIILTSQDSLSANIIRGFNLTVTLNPTDILRVDGRVNMTLRKNPETNKWAIIRWVDESNF